MVAELGGKRDGDGEEIFRYVFSHNFNYNLWSLNSYTQRLYPNCLLILSNPNKLYN